MKHEESVVYVLFVDRGDYYDYNQLHSIYKSKIKKPIIIHSHM